MEFFNPEIQAQLQRKRKYRMVFEDKPMLPVELNLATFRGFSNKIFVLRILDLRSMCNSNLIA